MSQRILKKDWFVAQLVGWGYHSKTDKPDGLVDWFYTHGNWAIIWPIFTEFLILRWTGIALPFTCTQTRCWVYKTHIFLWLKEGVYDTEFMPRSYKSLSLG